MLIPCSRVILKLKINPFARLSLPNTCVFFAFFPAMGTCLPVYGKKQGETCYRDTDCESGFLCLESICQTPMPGDKGLGKK